MPNNAGDLRRTVSRWRSLQDSDNERGLSVLVAASFTANPVVPSLGVTISDRLGLVPEIGVADFNQIFQICFDPGTYGADTATDIVIIWRIEDVFERDFHSWSCGDTDAIRSLVDGARALGKAIADLSANISGNIIVSDAPTPIGFGLDHDDPDLLDELVELQSTINTEFNTALSGSHIERLRLASLQHSAGTASSFNRRSWLMYRQPFTDAFAARVGCAIADIISNRTKPTPKVLVLDCDDTLWAGVAVDDGIGGLQCNDAFPGFAHRSFQFAVKRLALRGVLITLASKNDPDTVDEAFASVDGMVLSDDDIVTRRISWNPKPEALTDIAAELNLGIDSFVFVDDSDYEVGSMRTQLPDVTTLQVPDQIEALPDLLAESGLFRNLRVTDDDRERLHRMIAESERSSSSTTMTHDEFLSSLDLEVKLIRVGPNELGRVTQLINKTNQFNTTTIRHSEAAVESLIDDRVRHVYAAAVHDRFGEYGIVGVVIASDTELGWNLDSVLMSCRVLGRGVETAMLAGVVRDLRTGRAGEIAADYVPTERNTMVADLFTAHGFEEAPTGRFCLAGDCDVSVPEHITFVQA